MADETETQEAPKTWTATLRRGKSYVCFGTRFKNGEDQDITDEQKAYLEENAVDVFVVEGELDESGKRITEGRAKFSFRKIGTEKVAPPARRRTPA